jgi:hypothetical protein
MDFNKNILRDLYAALKKTKSGSMYNKRIQVLIQYLN